MQPLLVVRQCCGVRRHLLRQAPRVLLRAQEPGRGAAYGVLRKQAVEKSASDFVKSQTADYLDPVTCRRHCSQLACWLPMCCAAARLLNDDEHQKRWHRRVSGTHPGAGQAAEDLCKAGRHLRRKTVRLRIRLLRMCRELLQELRLD